MDQAIRRKATILPGGKLQIDSLELTTGQEVEVIVLWSEPAATKKLSEFLGAAPGVYQTQESADRAIRAERDAWES